MIRSRYRALNTIMSLASGFTGILDKFPGAVAAYSTRKLKTSYPTTLPADYGGGAAAAYSLRKVKSDYEGSAVKVRRSSDNELQDIGFDGNGNLDTTALLAFVNAEHTIADEDFSSSTGWTLAAGVTISGGVLSCSNSSASSAAYKNFGASDGVGTKIRVSFTISNYSGSGTISFKKFGSPTFTETSSGQGTARSGNGTYTEELTFSTIDANQNWGFGTNGNFTGDVDDFEVVQITADGTVNILYDQTSNGNDLSNSSASQQPQIVVAGSVTTKGGETALKFNDVEFLQKTSATTNWVAESNLSIFSVFSVTDYTAPVDADRQVLYNISGDEVASARGDTVVAMVRNDQMRIGFYEETVGWGETQGFQSPPDDTQILTSSIYDSSSTLTSTLNGSTTGTVISNPEANRAANTITIGSLHNGAKTLTGYVQEFVVLNSDQSTNRKDIEWNINNHYSIYDQWDRESCMNVRRSSDNATQDIGFSGKNINQTQLESFVNDASPVLDDYTGDDAAAAAYSLRKVRSAYTGSAINVRRSSDGTSQDIGFDANGDLDTTALTTFVNEDVTDDINTTTDSNADGLADGLSKLTNTPTATIVTGNGHIGSAQRMEYNVGAGTLQSIGINTLSTLIGQEITISFMYRSNISFSLGNGNDSAKGGFNGISANTGDAIRYEHKGVWSPSGGVDGRLQPMWLDASGEFVEISDWSVTYHTADGHVTTWYDQSGNDNRATADCSNPSACEQPLIVEAGDVVLDNNKPAIKFDGVDDYFTLGGTDDAGMLGDISVFSVNKNLGSSASVVISTGLTGSSTASLIQWSLTGGTSNRYTGTTSDGTTRINEFLTTANYGSQVLVSMINDEDGNLQLFADGVGSTGQTAVAPMNDANYPLEIGRDPFRSSYYFSGTMQELILYPSLPNRLSIEGNIGRYYNITGYRDGFVTKWYDQSGEYNHAENSTHDEQPLVVSGGTLVTMGGASKPAIQGSTSSLALTTALTPTNFSIIHTSEGAGFLASVGNYIRISDYYRLNIAGNNYSSSDANSANQSIYVSNRNGTTLNLRRNGSEMSSSPHTSVTTALNITKFFEYGSFNYPGKISEFIIFDSEQSSNLTGIEKNINTHFKIYS